MAETSEVKKITILGAGSVGCLTALDFAFKTWQTKKIQVELIHNPDTKPEKVAQAINPATTSLLYLSLGINLIENQMETTLKMGDMYEKWGKKNEYVPIPHNDTAMHICPDKLQDSILKSDWFEVKESDVLDYDKIDSDYIIDCAGEPTKEELKNDYKIIDGHVNSVLSVANQPGADLRQYWSRNVATPDGWCLEIPRGDNTKSYEYFYNDKITSEEKAKYNFTQYFTVHLPMSFRTTKLSTQFDQYIVKDPVIDNRIVLQGKKLCSFEPMEGTPLGAYSQWSYELFSWIVDGWNTPKELKKILSGMTKQTSNYINWHYTFGSQYDTPFWDKAKKDSVLKYLKEDDKRLRHIIKMAKQYSPKELRYKLVNNELFDTEFGCWHLFVINYWIEGMTKKINHRNGYPFY